MKKHYHEQINALIREKAHLPIEDLISEIKSQLNIVQTRDAVRNRLNRLGISRRQTVLTAEDGAKKDYENSIARREDKKTKEKYNVLLKLLQQAEKERDSVLSLHEGLSTFSIVPRKEQGKSEAVAVLVASDWHVEENIRPEQTQGRNEFNLSIAEQRAGKFFSNGLRLIEIAQRDTRVDTVVLSLLGDFMSGNIHDDLKVGNNLEPLDALIFAQNLIASGIRFLLDHGDFKLIVPCSVGNHGRITEKLHISTEIGHSMEYFMYRVLQKMFEKEKRVTFLIPQAHHTFVDAFGWKIRFSHGHAIRYNGGVGGPTIPLNKAIDSWNTNIKADYDVIGHLHQFFDTGRAIVNGSLMGYNPYAIFIKAKYEEPRQAFFLIDKIHGKSLVAPIWVN